MFSDQCSQTTPSESDVILCLSDCRFKWSASHGFWIPSPWGCDVHIAHFATPMVEWCQRTIARKTPATSHRVGSWRGIDQELANFEQLCVQYLALAISCCFILPRACTKSGWLEVEQELDMGCQLLTRTSPCWNCRGLSYRGSLATPDMNHPSSSFRSGADPPQAANSSSQNNK